MQALNFCARIAAHMHIKDTIMTYVICLWELNMEYLMIRTMEKTTLMRAALVQWVRNVNKSGM